MFWALSAGIGACANAGYFITNRNFLRKIRPTALAAAGYLCTGLFLLIISVIRGIPPVGPDFVFAAVVTVVLNIFATVLIFRALVSSDISLAIPMLSFTPLFLVGTAALLLGELPSVAGTMGIIIIVAGSYILNTSAGHRHLSDPFHDMVAHPGVMAMLCVAFIFSIAINFDKMVVLNTDSFYGPGIVSIMLGLSFAFIAAAGKVRVFPSIFNPLLKLEVPLPSNTPPASWAYILGAGVLTGVLLSVEAVSINTAYLLQIVPYIIAIKRMSIIIVVLYGTIIFREKEILRRLSGASLMVLGAILIVLFP